MKATTPAADRPQRRFNLLGTLVLHFRPRRVPERTLRFTLTWGLGGMAVVLVLLQLFSGLLLKFAYAPVPTQAYESLVAFRKASCSGGWSATFISGAPICWWSWFACMAYGSFSAAAFTPRAG